jgi:uridine phosphorylase
MPFPNFEGKHEHEAFFSPKDFLSFAWKQEAPADFVAPESAILIYQTSSMKYIREVEELEPLKLLSANGYLLKSSDGKIAVVADFGIGAPAASATLEELIALGVKRVISIGTAGGLQKHQQIGDLLICEKSIRDEGVSHHYVAPEKYAYADPELTSAFEREIVALQATYYKGTAWTIDTPFRETVAEVKQYQQEGILGVEMEAAALFAVAKYRNIPIASGFAVSDSLADLVWNPQFNSTATQTGLENLFKAAKATLLKVQ